VKKNVKKRERKEKKNIMKENFFDVLSWIFVLKYKNGNKNWNDDIYYTLITECFFFTYMIMAR